MTFYRVCLGSNITFIWSNFYSDLSPRPPCASKKIGSESFGKFPHQNQGNLGWWNIPFARFVTDNNYNFQKGRDQQERQSESVGGWRYLSRLSGDGSLGGFFPLQLKSDLAACRILISEMLYSKAWGSLQKGGGFVRDFRFSCSPEVFPKLPKKLWAKAPENGWEWNMIGGILGPIFRGELFVFWELPGGGKFVKKPRGRTLTHPKNEDENLQQS